MAISATKEYQRQKNCESYRRHKTAPDRKFGVYLTPEEVKANQKRWYQENKAKVKAQAKAWECANLERKKELARMQEAKPKTKAKRREWEKKNPEKIKAKNHRTRHKRRAAVGSYTETQWQARVDFYGRLCYLCGCDWDVLAPKEKTVDHIIPLSKGGTNWPSNLAPACRSCNSKKHNKIRVRKKKAI